MNVTAKRHRRVAVWNAGIYTVGNFAPQIVNVVLLPVLTRYLSPAEYGIFGYTTAVSAFVAIAGNLSIHSYAVRHAFEVKTEPERRRLFGTLFVFLAIYGGALLALQFAVMPLVFARFDVQVPFNPYMGLALVSVFIESLATIPLTYFRVKEQAGRFLLLSLLQFSLSMGLSLYLIIGLGTGVIGRYYGQLTANLVMLVIYLGIMTRVADFCFDRTTVKNAVVFSVPLALSGLFAALAAMFDRLVLERHLPLAALGIYTVGFAIAQGLSSLSNGIYRAIEPQIYRMTGEAGFNGRMVTLKQYLAAVLVMLGCLAIAFSREAVTLLAAPAFRESYRILALVSVRAVLLGVAIPANVYVVALKRPNFVAGAELTGGLVGVAGNLALIAVLGIYGAALTGIVAALAVLLAYTLVTERLGGVHWGVGRDLVWTAAAFAGAALVLQVQMQSLVAVIAIKAVLMAVLMAVWLVAYFGGPVRARQMVLGWVG